MTAADIQNIIREAAAVGYAVKITAAGTVHAAPAETPAARQTTMSDAERSRQYRQRRKNVTQSVTESGPIPPAIVTRHVTGEPAIVTNRHESSRVTQEPSPPLPPSPLSPTPPIPAPAHTPTPEGTRRERTREEAADFAAACAVLLDLTASPALKTAWAEWQVYRQRRHRQTGAGKLPWTLQAANLSAGCILRAVELHGEQIVTDRITAAIASNWQGLNFDKLPATTNGNHTRRPSAVTRNTSPLPPSRSLNATAYTPAQHHGFPDHE